MHSKGWRHRAITARNVLITMPVYGLNDMLLPVAKLGNFSYAENVKEVIEMKKNGGSGRRRSSVRRKSMTVDHSTGMTSSSMIEIDAFILNDEFGQVMYDDVGKCSVWCSVVYL